MVGRRQRWVGAALCVGALAAGCAAPGSTAGTGATTVSRTVASSVTSQAAPSTPSSSNAPATTTVPALPSCTDGALPTVAAGKLTVGTGTPRAPWFTGAPGSGQGLESAVAYAVADGLGYPREAVTWLTVDRAQASAGAATGVDLALDQFTAADGGATVDHSTGYFSVTDAVLARADAKPAAAVAAIHGQKLGSVAGSLSASAAEQAAGTPPVTYQSTADAVRALSDPAGTQTVAAVVLPVTAALAAAQSNPAVAVVGQLPAADPSVQPDQLTALLRRNSALTGCVSAVIDRLRVEGTLDQLAAQWVDPMAPRLR